MLVGLNITKPMVQCGVNGLYPRVGREKFSALFEVQSSFQTNKAKLLFFQGALRLLITVNLGIRKKNNINKIVYMKMVPKKYIIIVREC